MQDGFSDPLYLGAWAISHRVLWILLAGVGVRSCLDCLTSLPQGLRALAATASERRPPSAWRIDSGCLAA